MSKKQIPYFQKLLDPRWQKKRLEALQATDWLCECCMDGEETLHVHHKQYFKGKEPWEYEVGQLSVLCKTCHENSHGDVDPLLWVASFAPMSGPLDRDDASWLLAGALSARVDALKQDDEYAYGRSLSFFGRVAYEIANKIVMSSGTRDLLELDPCEVADFATKAIFEHYGLSLKRERSSV